MTNIILVRHGETVWNLEQRYQGQKDSPLSDQGFKQAKLVAQLLSDRKIAAIYSSDLRRARLTATEIGKPHKLPIISESRLREVSFGVWEGLTRTQVLEQYPDLYRERFANTLETRVPGGELPEEVLQRLLNFLEEVLLKHENETIVFVSHGAALRYFIASLLQMPLELAYQIKQHNAAVSEFSFSQDGARRICQVLYLNCSCHLKAD